MEIKKYDQFLNEAKKDDAKEEILKMLKSKPTITMSNENWPTEKGIYSQAGMIRHLKDQYTTQQVLNALHDIKNDKSVDIKFIRVMNYKYNEPYPYYYLGLTEAEAKDIKEKYEEKNEVVNKKFVDKRKETKEASKKAASEKRPAKKVAKRVGAKKVGMKKVGAKKIEAKKATK